MDDKRRIVIDEDWKEKVQRERESVQSSSGDADASSSSGDADQETTTADQAAGPEFPPAELETLVGILLTPAMASLGMIPDPIQGEVRVDLPQAKFYIDLLSVIEEKTRGNLSAEEKEFVEHWLNQLRMAYVARGHQA